MSGSNDTAITQDEHGLDWVDDVRVRDRVDLVHPEYLAISTEIYFVSAANDVEMSDAHVVFHKQLLDARDDVEMTDRYVVIQRALARVDDAEPDPNSFTDAIAEKEAIEGAF